MSSASPRTSDALPHLLVVDDDERLRALLARYLEGHGFRVTTAPETASARILLQSLVFDAAIVDVMMPGEDGIAFTASLQRTQKALTPPPILLLTARGEAGDRIAGLGAGADDYLPKPFEPEELLLRVRAILRRTRGGTEDGATGPLRLGAWTYDPDRDTLERGTQRVRLTGMEASLMRALASAPGVALSRADLVRKTGQAGNVNDRTVDVQVRRLRCKMEDDPQNPRFLVTVRGEGYKLAPERP